MHHIVMINVKCGELEIEYRVLRTVLNGAVSEPCQNDAVTRNFYTTNSAIAITFPQFLVIRLQMSECLLQVRVEH